MVTGVMIEAIMGGKYCCTWFGIYIFLDTLMSSLVLFLFSDLYLMHWPDTHVPGKSNREVRAETWRAMEELYEQGDTIMKTCPCRRNCSTFGELIVRVIQKLSLIWMLIFWWDLGVQIM